VTLEEAFAELGIDRDAGSDGARRAYLRLLKTRKPETDPEGFMRLRAAYELVKEILPRLEAFRAREPAAPTPPEVVAAVEPAPAVIDAPPAAVEAAPAVVDPGSAGEMAFLIARGEYAGAADQALFLLAAATLRLRPPDPPVDSLLRLMLTLHGNALAPKAREVSSAFKVWLAATGKESTHIHDETAVLWTLVRELDALKKGLPTRLRSVIARAALAGDLSQAQTVFKYFWLAQPAEAEAVGALLRRKAPVIAAALADLLEPPPRPVAPPPRPRQPAGERVEGTAKWLWYAPLVIGLLQVFSMLGKSANSAPIQAPTVYQTRPPTYPTPSFDAGAPVESMSKPEPAELLSSGNVSDAGPRDAGPRERSIR
jgi:hypothetical protein